MATKGYKIVGKASRETAHMRVQGDLDLKVRIEESLRCGGFEQAGRPMSMRVRDGMVKLEGSVLYERDIHSAGSLVEAVDGVVSLQNWLLYRIPDPDRGGSSARDSISESR